MTESSLKPTLLIANAFGMPESIWSGFVREVSAEADIVHWNPRGFEPGDSIYYSLDDHVNDLSDVLTNLSGQRKCIRLVSWCGAAKLALAAISKSGVYCDRHALLAPNLANTENQSQFLARLYKLSIFVERRPELANKIAELIIDSQRPGSLLESQMSELVENDNNEAMIRVFKDEKVLLKYCRTVREYQSFDCEGMTEVLATSSKIFHARDDRTVGVEQTIELVQPESSFEHEVFEVGGHFLMQTRNVQILNYLF